MTGCKLTEKVFLEVLVADCRIPRFPLKEGAWFCAAA